MSIGLFIDGQYLYQVVGRRKIDFIKLREMVERELNDIIDEGYYFSADDDPPLAEKFHNALSYPPPSGPGLRVKVYWLQRKKLFWPDGTPVIHPTERFQYESITQKAVDVGLMYHLTRAFHKRQFTRLALISGDGDFHEPVQNLVENENVELYLVGSMNSMWGELRPYARRILEIDREPLISELLYRPAGYGSAASHSSAASNSNAAASSTAATTTGQ
ncbi:MAG: NYN domain-containing protein [Oscillospiraceae bacterium]|nr:NYN domain-containing protein [Oscillospiraceae bacterium]